MNYHEIGNIFAETSSACEKAGCYEEVANHSKRGFTLIEMRLYEFFLHLWHNTLRIWKVKIRLVGHLDWEVAIL